MMARTSQPLISVVIPVFNEADQLPATLDHLEGNGEPYEIILVDARSTDDTAAIARKRGVRVIISDVRQRAGQMNAGARIARGEILLFLHADTWLAAGGLDRIASCMRDLTIIGGGFARRYDSPSILLRFTCLLAEVRTRLFGWFLGDQAIFIRRATFDELGGFREWDIFEDLDFSRRMIHAGRVVTLRPPVISAGRRFAALGALRTTWKDICLTANYLRGRHPSSMEAPKRKSNPAFFVTAP